MLRWTAFLVFASQAWIHFFWGAPFHALLRNEAMLASWAGSLLNLSWEEFAAGADAAVPHVVRGFGIFYGLCAVAAWTARPGRPAQMILLGLGSLALASLAFLKFLDHDLESPQLIEHTAVWSTPLLLVAALSSGRDAAHVPVPALTLALKVAVALAFTGHGFYAAGILPVPDSFITMTTQCLGLSEPAARLFLKVAGYLDFAVAIGIFLPRASVLFLIYATTWGALTALARVVSHSSLTENSWGMDPWLAETLTRAPHALLPFALLLPWLSRRKNSRANSYWPKPEESMA